MSEGDLIYSATECCLCGAGLAYKKGAGIGGHWQCSEILLGRANAVEPGGTKKHLDHLPFIKWQITSERQPSANGNSTRPQVNIPVRN